MTSSLELDGFDLTTRQSPRGGQFKLLRFEGWHSVKNNRDRQKRSQQAGTWPSTGYPDALTITASGRAIYSDPVQAALERRELEALAQKGTASMTVVDAAGAGSREVEVDSIDVTPVSDWAIRWTIVATANDPLLYGEPKFDTAGLSSALAGTGRVWPRVWPRDWGVDPDATPGQVRVDNAGLADYFPHLQVDGPVTNPVITLVETGDRIAYRGTVRAGQFLDIDCGRRRVVLASRSNPDSVISMRQLVSFVGAWMAVPPGGATVQWTADDADPAATLSVSFYEGAWP